jgi:hypothetical protein
VVTKQPLWTRIGFAWFLAVALLALAMAALRVAAMFANLDISPLARSRPENTRAIVMLVLSMLLVVAAIALPLVVRHRAQRRLTEAEKPAKLRP